MITSAYSSTATERVLPKLALDFTTANLDSRITFTRALNTATRVNSSGYIESVNANLPRFDYNPITLECKGLLIEETRANIVWFTENINGTGWASANATRTTDTTTSPANNNTADTWTVNANGASTILSPVSASFVVGSTITASAFVKKSVGADWIYFGLRGPDFNHEAGTFINIVTGQIGNSSVLAGTNVAVVAGSIKAIPYPNGWYRVVSSYTTSATTTCSIAVRASRSNGSISNSVAGDAYNVWGFQAEVGSFETSYIPRLDAASATRNADVATMTGTNFSDWWTATTGGATISVIPKSISGTNPLFQIDDNTADNLISLRGNTSNPELYIKATTDQTQIDAGTIVANTAYKLSGAWNTNSCAAAQNGTAAVTDSSATIPTVTQARIGSDGTNYANAWIQKISYWPQRLINAEVQAFSK